MNDRTPLETEPYKGVRDFYPADWARLQHIFETVRTTLVLHGFEEYNASPLERSELYERKTSEEIVNDQTYTFEDRGGRRVTLRPEMTPSLARMIAGKRRELVFPARWFSIGNRFRYERPQKGRLREFYQIDVDLVGIEGVREEGEAVVMASKILTALGAKNEDFQIRINSRKMLNAAGAAAGLTEEQTSAYLALLDRKEKMEAAAFEAERDQFRKEGRDPLEVIEAHDDAATEAAYQELQQLIAAFGERGMTNVVFSPATVRGFLYYTGIVFEVFDTDPVNPRALLGGGRYDGLVAMFGGDALPAVGFAIGDTVLADFLETHGYLPEITSSTTVYLGTPSESDIAAAQALAEELRAQGVATLVNTSSKALGDQVKEAVRRSIPYFIAVGAEEASSGSFRVKELAKSSEETVTRSELAAHLSR